MVKPHTQNCPVAGMLNIVGDQWTWLILREAFYGASRFKEFERNTGIAKNLLSNRLARLVDEGLLKKFDIGQMGTRYAYSLTPKGRSLNTVMIAMLQWGNEHLYAEGEAPVEIIERQTGVPIGPLVLQTRDGRRLEPKDIKTVPGPGAKGAVRQRLAAIKDNP